MNSTDKRFYIATDYARKQDAAGLAARLEDLGFESTGRWYTSQPAYKDDGLGGILEGADAEAAALVAGEDFDDVEAATIFIQLTSGEKARGGRHVELGYALCMQARYSSRVIVIVGPEEHAFHYHPQVVRLRNEAQLESFLLGLVKGWETA